MRSLRRTDLMMVGGLGLFTALLSGVALLLPIRPLETLELRSQDLRLRLRPAILASPQIVCVDADDKSSQAFGRWPWPRRQHAGLIRALHAAGARAIVFDVLFTQPSNPDDDQILAAEAARAGTVHLAAAPGLTSEPDARQASAASAALPERVLWRPHLTGRGAPLGGTPGLVPLPALQAGVRGIGHIIGMPDADGRYRRMPLLVRVGEADFLPGLILPAVLELEGFDKPRLSVAWGDALSIQGSGGKELRIPIDDGGRLRLDFPGPWATVIPHYAAVDVIRAAESSDTLAQAKQAFGGKIVVVANATTGSGDVGATPTDARYPLGELHAVLAENLFARRFLREVSGWVGAALAPLFAGGASTLLLTMATGRGVALALLPLLGLIGAAWGLGLAGILLPVVLPGLGWGVGLVGTLGYRHWSGERERRRLVAAFTGYLPPQVIRRVLEEPDRDPLKVRRKELSVLFADIQGFTSLTDQVEPEVIRGILSEYFEAMTEIIFAQQGTLDKFMGDGLLAFFGDAEDAPDHAERAVRAALAMQRRVRELADGWVAKGLEPLRVRVGVNTGYVTVGNLGSPRRMDYTVIGREVNLASRIQSAAVPGGVLISRRTHALVQGIPLKTTHQQIEAKGFSHPIDVYGVEVE